MVPSSVLMSTLDPMADQRAPVLSHSSLPMMPATLFNNSTVTTGKAAHLKSARIDSLALVVQASVVVVVDSVHVAALVEASVVAVVHSWEEAVAALAVEQALEAVAVDLEEATEDLQVVAMVDLQVLDMVDLQVPVMVELQAVAILLRLAITLDIIKVAVINIQLQATTINGYQVMIR